MLALIFQDASFAHVQLCLPPLKHLQGCPNVLETPLDEFSFWIWQRQVASPETRSQSDAAPKGLLPRHPEPLKLRFDMTGDQKNIPSKHRTSRGMTGCPGIIDIFPVDPETLPCTFHCDSGLMIFPSQ